MRAVCLMSLITFGIVWAGAETIHAQPLVARAVSIESTVANADLVFIAKLVKLRDAKQVDGRAVHSVTIAIEQTLKMEICKDEPYELLQVDVPYQAAVLTDWVDRSCRLLVVYDEYTPYATTVIELVPGKMEVLKADFTLLCDPEAVVRAANEALRRMSPAVKRIHTFGLHVPLNLVTETRWDKYQGLILNVPVDEQLEKRAIEYIRSDNYSAREEAVRALRYFKSDENIARLKAMLSDPGWAYLYHAPENKGVEVRIYGVRQEAYRNLKSWGVDVDKPVVREEIATSAR